MRHGISQGALEIQNIQSKIIIIVNWKLIQL